MKNRILRTSLGFALLSFGASALNFIFYPVTSHLLSLADFGDVQIGVSFIMLAATLFTSLNTLALYVSAEHNKKAGLFHIEKLVVAFCIVGALLTTLLAAPLASMLNLQDASLIYLLAIVFILNIPAATWLGALQGNGQFLASGFVSIIAALIKVLAAIAFIKIGLGAQGALLGVVLGTFSILPLVKLFQNQHIVSFGRTFRFLGKSDFEYLRSHWSLGAILAALIIVSSIATLDVTFAKIFLSSEQAGSFAQVSTAAKIPYFAIMPIAIVLFERILKGAVKGKDALRFFTILLLLGTVLTFILSDFILQVIFGHHDSLGIFNILLGSFSLYSVVMLLAYILITKQRVKRFFIGSIFGATTSFGVLLVNHSNPTDISYSFLFGVCVTLLTFIALGYTRAHE